MKEKNAQIRITVRDLLTGEEESVEIADTYVLITAGQCYEDCIQIYSTKGTHVITVMGAGGGFSRPVAQP